MRYMSLCRYLHVLPVHHMADVVGIFNFFGVNNIQKNMLYALLSTGNTSKYRQSNIYHYQCDECKVRTKFPERGLVCTYMGMCYKMAELGMCQGLRFFSYTSSCIPGKTHTILLTMSSTASFAADIVSTPTKGIKVVNGVSGETAGIN